MTTLGTRLEHEEVIVRTGLRSGLPVIVAIHSTRLGPAAGRGGTTPADAARELAARHLGGLSGLSGAERAGGLSGPGS